MQHSPAEHVRRPAVPAESPTLGFTHLQFEALLTAARESANPSDFALVAMLGLLGLRIFEATSANITDLGEEHGHRVLRVCGKGSKVAQVPLPPAVSRAIDRATGPRDHGPILLNNRGTRMDRHAPPAAFGASLAAPGCGQGHTRICSATHLLSVLPFRPEARRNPGLAASCLMSIRYSVRYVLEGRYQCLSLFDAAFDLTWLTCLSSENEHLPGTLRSPVQITAAMRLRHAGIDVAVIALWLGHEQMATANIYLHADMEEKERAIARVTPPGTAPGRYQPPDPLLAFLDSL
jgi:integrase